MNEKQAKEQFWNLEGGGMEVSNGFRLKCSSIGCSHNWNESNYGVNVKSNVSP